MTADEPFLLAVVDQPGDETARLAYADWLDERGDPRGAYLRAESCWAVARRRGTASADPPEPLRAAAALLDPAWVLRVSRPPLGVCCDHLGPTGPGPRLTTDHLVAVEQRLGIPLPTTYRLFMLNHHSALATARLLGPHPTTGRLMDFCFFAVDPAQGIAGGSYGRGFGWWNSPDSGYEPGLQIGRFGRTGHCVLQVGADPRTGEDLTGQVWYYSGRSGQGRCHAPHLPAFLALLHPA